MISVSWSSNRRRLSKSLRQSGSHHHLRSFKSTIHRTQSSFSNKNSRGDIACVIASADFISCCYQTYVMNGIRSSMIKKQHTIAFLVQPGPSGSASPPMWAIFPSLSNSLRSRSYRLFLPSSSFAASSRMTVLQCLAFTWTSVPAGTGCMTGQSLFFLAII